MNCCEQYMPDGCRQGRECPAAAAKVAKVKASYQRKESAKDGDSMDSISTLVVAFVAVAFFASALAFVISLKDYLL